jgi:hypothetical protein
MALAKYGRNLSPLTRRLIVFAFVNSAVVGLAMMALFLTPWRLTIFGSVHDFLVAAQGQDSWGPMGHALDYLGGEGERERALYDEIFFAQQRKFQYPPTSLLPLYALSALAARSGLSVLGLLNALSWASIAVSVFFTVRCFELGVARSGLDGAHGPSRAERVTRMAVVAFMALTFYPLIKAYTQGQIQAWINALFAAALWLSATARPTGSAVLIGAATLLKPQYGLFAVWGLLRRKWSFVVVLALTMGAGLAVSLAWLGITDHLNYLDVVRFLSERGESYYPNQSVNGLLHRLLFNGYNLGWKGRAFPPFHPWIYLLTAASSIALVLVALMWGTARRERGGTTDFCVVGLTVTIASPVAWEHHYGILPPIFAYLLPRLWVESGSKPGHALAWLAASYVLCSNFFAFSTALAPVPVANVLQSYLFFGALILWFLLLARRRAGAE